MHNLVRLNNLPLENQWVYRNYRVTLLECNRWQPNSIITKPRRMLEDGQSSYKLNDFFYK
jgi:hypothetical protein